MAEEPPYIVDIDGLGETPDEPEPASATEQRWIGVQFECCGAYARIYRNREKTAYVGHCPRCSRPVRVRIGPGGTQQRMFRAH